MILNVYSQNEEVFPLRKERLLRDFCYDLIATSIEEVAPNVYRYGTGLHFVIKEENGLNLRNSDICVTIRPRSSIWKTGMVLSNSVGTIDIGYTGEVSAVFYHVMPNMPKYEIGDRIGQMHLSVSPVLEIRPMSKEAFDNHCNTINAFDKSFRGSDGYGSTGK